MPTISSLFDKINRLRILINRKTKHEDPTLTDAVVRLINTEYNEIGSNDYLLPTQGYTAMKYIESSGRQYIDADYILTENSKIRCTGCWTTITSESAPNLFGSSVPYAHLRSDRPLTMVKVTYGTAISEQITYTGAKVPHSYILDKTGFIVDGKAKYQALTFGNTNWMTGDNSLILFACWNMNGYIGNYSASRIYRFTIYESNEVTADFIPCMRNEDEVLGLYDIVRNRFFTNQGMGTFSSEEEE